MFYALRIRGFDVGEWREIPDWVIKLAAILSSLAIIARFLWKPGRQALARFSDFRDVMNRVDILLMDSATLFLALEESVALCQFDPDGRCTMIGLALEDLSGCSAQDLKGFGWRSMIHEEDRDRVEHRMTEAFRDKSVFRDSFRFAKSGNVVVMTLRPLRARRSGRLIGFGARFEIV